MLVTLIRKELLANLLTLRLGAGFVVTVVLSVLATAIGTMEYAERLAAYQREQSSIGQALEQATVYAQVHPDLVVPPQPLSLFCRGVDEAAGQGLRISTGYVPAALSRIGGSYSGLMKSFVPIDLCMVVTVVLSFLAVVLGFDGICGEREQGTLAQLLANPVPRVQVVLAKLTGGVLSLWTPLAVAFVLSLLVVTASPAVILSGADWVRLGLILVLSCLFLAQVFALSLMVSSLVRESALSLILCLFGWLLGSVGYLNLLPSITRYAVSEAPYQVFVQQRQALWDEYQAAVSAWEAAHPSPGEAYLQGLQENLRLRYAHPRGYAWLEQRNAAVVELDVDRANRVHQALAANFRYLGRQAQLVDRCAVLSPFASFRTLASQLAGTTLDDKDAVLAAGRQYRQTFLQYLRGRRAFADRRWFTDDPPDQEPMIADPSTATPALLAPNSPFMKERLAWMQEQQRLAAQDASRHLDLADLPRFPGLSRRPLAEVIMAAAPGLAVLVLILGLSVLVTVRRFAAYDPR
ncbi:MAG: ABC transporter permease subunit [Candidatus Latescibacterota bacterium]